LSLTRYRFEYDGNGKETTMNIRILVTLMLTLLAVSACVIEPIGRGGGGRGYYGGGHERGVWRG
jgi:hypothetical protein